MSFLKRLLGLGARRDDAEREAAPAVLAEAEHKGFRIRATPMKVGGEFQPCGLIDKEVDGVRKEHRFIRVDRFTDQDQAAQFSLAKGRQIIDEQGERMFG